MTTTAMLVGVAMLRSTTSGFLVTACAAGGCTGADGVHYNTGGSGVTVDPAGRTCHRVGTTVQCF